MYKAFYTLLSYVLKFLRTIKYDREVFKICKLCKNSLDDQISKLNNVCIKKYFMIIYKKIRKVFGNLYRIKIF